MLLLLLLPLLLFRLYDSSLFTLQAPLARVLILKRSNEQAVATDALPFSPRGICLLYVPRTGWCLSRGGLSKYSGTCYFYHRSTLNFANTCFQRRHRVRCWYE